MKCTNFSYETSLEKIFITEIFEFLRYFHDIDYVQMMLHNCEGKLDFAQFHRFVHIQPYWMTATTKITTNMYHDSEWQ